MVGLPLAVFLTFAASVLTGHFLGQDADYYLPMAAAVAFGSGVGQVIRVLRAKRPKAAAWPQLPPPPRPD